MVTTIKKGVTKKEVQALFDKLANESSIQKGFDAHKYCGKVVFKEDGLSIQKRLRNEWK